MRARKPPYCTENGVHIFVEDLVIAALEYDSRNYEWRQEWRETPDSIFIAEWLTGSPFTAIARRHKKTADSVSRRISRICDRAERSAGLGARPIFDAIIRAERAAINMQR